MPAAPKAERLFGETHVERRDAKYAGDASRSFWNRVNRLKGEDHVVLYALGCVLQNLESDVLLRLRNAEEDVEDGPYHSAAMEVVKEITGRLPLVDTYPDHLYSVQVIERALERAASK